MRHKIDCPVKPLNEKKTNHAMFQVVRKEKVQRIATDHNPKTLLVVDRISNKATPVLILGNHFYYRIRNSLGQIIWVRHIMEDKSLSEKPLEERSPEEQMVVAYWNHWNMYNYVVDFQKRIQDNAALYFGERIDPMDSEITLQFNP